MEQQSRQARIEHLYQCENLRVHNKQKNINTLATPNLDNESMIQVKPTGQQTLLPSMPSVSQVMPVVQQPSVASELRALESQETGVQKNLMSDFNRVVDVC